MPQPQPILTRMTILSTFLLTGISPSNTFCILPTDKGLICVIGSMTLKILNVLEAELFANFLFLLPNLQILGHVASHRPRALRHLLVKHMCLEKMKEQIWVLFKAA